MENYGNSAQASHGGGDSTDASNPNDDGSGTDNTHSGTRNYGENEFAEIYLPASGRITTVYTDLGSGDTVTSQQAPAGAATAIGAVSTTTQFNGGQGLITWSSDGGRPEDDLGNTGKGWTVVFEPAYPYTSITAVGDDSANFPSSVYGVGHDMTPTSNGFVLIPQFASMDAGAAGRVTWEAPANADYRR